MFGRFGVRLGCGRVAAVGGGLLLDCWECVVEESDLVCLGERGVDGGAEEGQLPAEEVARVVLSADVGDTNGPVTDRVFIPSAKNQSATLYTTNQTYSYLW